MFYFRDTTYTKSTIPNPVNITCPYHGRYIIYFNNRTHQPCPTDYSLHATSYLCEVQIYGNPIQRINVKAIWASNRGVSYDEITKIKIFSPCLKTSFVTGIKASFCNRHRPKLCKSQSTIVIDLNNDLNKIFSNGTKSTRKLKNKVKSLISDTCLLIR